MLSVTLKQSLGVFLAHPPCSYHYCLPLGTNLPLTSVRQREVLPFPECVGWAWKGLEQHFWWRQLRTAAKSSLSRLSWFQAGGVLAVSCSACLLLGRAFLCPLLSAALLHHLRQQQSSTAQGCVLGQDVKAHWLPAVLSYKGNNWGQTQGRKSTRKMCVSVHCLPALTGMYRKPPGFSKSHRDGQTSYSIQWA